MRCPAADVPRGADVVVIGAGLSGLEFAAELVSRGVRDLVVLEAGPALADDRDEVRLMADWQRPGADPALWRPWSSDRPPHYAGVCGVRRRVGGRSLYWRGITLPIEDRVLRDPAWPAAVSRDLRQGCRRGCALYEELGRDLTEWAGRPLDAPRGPGEQALLALLDQAHPGRVVPVPLARRYWTRDGKLRWCAYRPLERWAQVGGHVGGFAKPLILPDSRVIGLEASAGRVTGVGLHRGRIPCQAVVLAAAAIENARLVAQVISTSGQEKTAFTGLTDHLRQGFFVKVDAARMPPGVPLEGLALLPARQTSGSNLFVEVRRAAVPDFVIWDVWAIGEQERSGHSGVRFPDRGSIPWQTLVCPALSPRDETTIQAQRIALSAVWRTIRQIVSGGPGPDYGGFLDGGVTYAIAHEQVLAGEAGRAVGYCSPLGSVDHEGGLTPLGEVLRDTGEVAGITGLYVLGPGTFPRAGVANPSFTTLALARRTARVLAGG